MKFKLPNNYKSRRTLVALTIILLVIIGVVIYLVSKKPQQKALPSPVGNSNSQTKPQTTPSPAPAPTPEPVKPTPTPASVSDPSSLTAVINKQRPLPAGYVPPNLVAVAGGTVRSEAATNLNQLLQDAQSAGVGMKIISSYRSYATQQSTYNGWVARDGVAQADTYSARPGYSEHQTGLAIDLGNGTCDLEICFGTTASGIWLKNNAPKYGFVIRYPQGKTSVTGYQYEPWHIRYIGSNYARQVGDLTLEEYFKLPAAPSY